MTSHSCHDLGIVEGLDCSTYSEYANCVSEWSDAGGSEYDTELQDTVEACTEEVYPTIEEFAPCTEDLSDVCFSCECFDKRTLLCCLQS